MINSNFERWYRRLLILLAIAGVVALIAGALRTASLGMSFAWTEQTPLMFGILLSCTLFGAIGMSIIVLFFCAPGVIRQSKKKKNKEKEQSA